MAGFSLQVVLASCTGVSIRSWGDDEGREPPRINQVPGRSQRYVHVEPVANGRAILFVRPIDEDGNLVTRSFAYSWGERGAGPTPILQPDTPGCDILIGPECAGHWLLTVRDMEAAGIWQGSCCLPIFVRDINT
jgi:hypothetical protein